MECPNASHLPGAVGFVDDVNHLHGEEREAGLGPGDGQGRQEEADPMHPVKECETAYF